MPGSSGGDLPLLASNQFSARILVILPDLLNRYPVGGKLAYTYSVMLTKQEEKALYADSVEYTNSALANDFPGARILHQSSDDTGTVVTVFEDKDGVRHYHSDEFTIDGCGDEWYLDHAMGYHTTDRYHYMGERYRGMNWGPYRDEVYYNIENPGAFYNGEKITLKRAKEICASEPYAGRKYPRPGYERTILRRFENVRYIDLDGNYKTRHVQVTYYLKNEAGRLSVYPYAPLD